MGVAFKACYLPFVLSELLFRVGLADEDLLNQRIKFLGHVFMRVSKIN